MRTTRVCEICGNEYIATNGKSKYCSEECKKIAYKIRQKRFKEKNPNYMKEWKEKNKDYQKNYAEKNKEHIARLKRGYRNELLDPKKCKCEVCGKEFETFVKRKVTCSKKCSDIRKYRARAKWIKENGNKEHINLKTLYERDGGKCHICGGKCDWKDIKNSNYGEKYIGEKYPTIDHVIPLSKGGTHTWDNVKLAHHYCNTKKNQKV